MAVLWAFAAQIGETIPGWAWPLSILFLILFVAADLTVFRVEVRRHAVGVSVTDIPLLLALFFLPPVLLVAARAVATLCVMASQGQAKVKLWFNVASLAAGAALASLIVRAGSPLDGQDPLTWLVLAAAVAANVLVTLTAVLGAVSLVQGRIVTRDFMRTAIPALPVAALNITIGIVVLVLLQQGAWSLLLLAVVTGFLVISYRSYVQSVRHSRSLSEMYELTRVVADTPHDGTLADVLLGRVREMLQAEYATLWIPASGRHPEVLLSAKVDYRALLDVSDTPEPIRQRAFTHGASVAVGPRLGDESLRPVLRRTGTKDVIVVPLRAGSAVIGCLEVSGRIGDTAFFGPADVRLLETIAAHAAVAVENSRLVERLRFDAYHDSLTGLPNRRRITDALGESISGRTPGEMVAVLLLDVGGLRDVNESLGRAAGDQLLVEVARRLRAAAPSAALVGRIGGDAFVVTLPMADEGAALSLAGSLRQELRDPLTVGSLTLDVDVAVGVTLHPEHGPEPSVLLQRADLATQAAKGLVGGVQLFNKALESGSARRLGLAADLRQALDDDELEVYFQPKVSIPDRRLVGVECLARWEHPGHGSVPPPEFVAVAEHTGLLGQLTEAVLTAGLRRARQWAQAGHPLPVAINLSSRTLMDPSFPARVSELLREYEVDPELLTFEITEDGSVGEADQPLPTLHQLAELGVRLSVDDFGTGYSSLSYLSRLPVHEVKIDQSFVQGMATDAGDLAIVRAVVDLARHFDLTVVAEGVESELTLNLLEEIGCDIGQGFLFSRPLPYERLEAWFAAQTDAEPHAGGQVRRLRAVG
ncbi:GGDEF and EAL domain-containing protein [Natronosporangium hydrolyticum]|uniref:GGDEF and EAL domain-containing protein n=1 Tax=Natronosporangium hydrolyticum TaxID=2811111 RepID=A0A895YCH7_9ACTN|nr:GGDEF and EAL domain-containing protein [Natronosporangium hydrolyticum]QSB15497.1 GGDEF and EAL domain-containing protein [Natronosporangium hydrolyticum]